jgi:hypothetical protein
MGVQYVYDARAVDDDNDTLSFSLLNKSDGMSIDAATGRIIWTPSASQIGNHTITVGVSDGRGGKVEQTFVIRVWDSGGPPVTPVKPGCTITSHTNGTKVSKRITITGKATKGTAAIASVQVRIDGGSWSSAVGTESWSYVLDTIGLTKGPHIVEVRAFDGTNYSDASLVTLNVDNPSPTVVGGAFPWWIFALVVVGIAAVGLIFGIARRKRAPSPAKTQVAAEEKPASSSATKDAMPAVSSTETKTPQETAIPEPIAVDDIFLTYRDGRLISHNTRRLQPGMDDDVLAGMFTAVQEFIKESLGGDEERVVDEISYSGSRVLIERGKYVVLAVVIMGEGRNVLREGMKTVVNNIEAEFGPLLVKWDGNAKALKGAKKWIRKLLTGEAIEGLSSSDHSPTVPPPE